MTTFKTKDSNQNKIRILVATGMFMGIGMGVTLGIVKENLLLGVVLGAGLGMLIGYAMYHVWKFNHDKEG